jgi:hypothetical protein
MRMLDLRLIALLLCLFFVVVDELFGIFLAKLYLHFNFLPRVIHGSYFAGHVSERTDDVSIVDVWV